MRKRTKAREIAIQALYQLELRGYELGNELEMFFKQQDILPEVLDFAKELVNGCKTQRHEIDLKIIAISENWDLHRMAIIDRCVLRLGAYELLYRDDIPPKVAINEAIDLAKKFSTDNSGTFVNGILDKVYSRYKGQRDNNKVDGANIKDGG